MTAAGMVPLRWLWAALMWQGGAAWLGRGLEMARWVAAARLLPPEPLGWLLLAQALAMAAALPLQWGCRRLYLTLDDAACPPGAGEVLWRAGVMLPLAALLLVMVVALLLQQILPPTPLTTLTPILAAVGLARSLVSLRLWRCERQLDFAPVARQQILWGILCLVGLTLGAAVSGHATGAAWGWLAGALLAAGLSHLPLPQTPCPRYPAQALPWGWLWAQRRFGAQWMWIGVFAFAGVQGGELLVGAWLGPALLAQYALAWRLAHAPLGLVTAPVNRVCFPLHGRWQGRDARTLILWQMALTAGVTAGVLLVLGVFRHWVVPALFGSGWALSATLLPGALAAAWLRGINDVLGSRSMACGDGGRETRRRGAEVLLLLCGLALGGAVDGAGGVAWGAAVVQGVLLAERLFKHQERS
ncbi:MAG: oligosaccharide flippase family protein [Magnetococcus sp. WYHC-3]